MHPFTPDIIIIAHSGHTPRKDIGRREIAIQNTHEGFSECIFHYVIRRSGLTEVGRSLEKPSLIFRPLNGRALGICIIGGVTLKSQQTFGMTEPQLGALMYIIDSLKSQYPGGLTVKHLAELLKEREEQP